jgi:excisionase family DNA binding protein
MSEQPATLQDVTVAEAAEILGVSTATVRRMVKRGQLEGEQVQRPQGTAFVVRLPMDASQAAADATSTQQVPGVTPRGNASAPELMAAWSEAFLSPIMTRMAEQEAVIRQLEWENGRQTAELEALRAQNAALLASTSTERPDPTTASGPWWRRWLWGSLRLTIVMVGAGVLLAWPG